MKYQNAAVKPYKFCNGILISNIFKQQVNSIRMRVNELAHQHLQVFRVASIESS